MGSKPSFPTFLLCDTGQVTSAQLPHCLSFPICKMGLMLLPSAKTGGGHKVLSAVFDACILNNKF